jgi:hypothetical protein
MSYGQPGTLKVWGNLRHKTPSTPLPHLPGRDQLYIRAHNPIVFSSFLYIQNRKSFVMNESMRIPIGGLPAPPQPARAQDRWICIYTLASSLLSVRLCIYRTASHLESANVLYIQGGVPLLFRRPLDVLHNQPARLALASLQPQPATGGMSSPPRWSRNGQSLPSDCAGSGIQRAKQSA